MIPDVLDEPAVGYLTDEVLAARATDDFNAFAELYDRYLCRIYRFVRSQTPDDATAEDLTAQVFFRALAGADTFKGRGSYRSWIFRIAHNTIMTWRTKRDRSPLVVEELPESADPGPSPAALAVAAEEKELVRRLVATLPGAQREVLSLRYLEDLNTHEIARITGRTRGAIRILLHRARSSLRSAVEGSALR